MINEVNIYKTVNEKQFTKCKYLLSKLLKYLYNTLKAGEHFGARKRFAIVSEAIFFMLSETKPQITWVDYSTMLETGYKQKTNFPAYLKAHFNEIQQYYYTCPVVAQNSNESTLIGIVEKLLIKCDDTNNSEMDVDDDSGTKSGTINIEGVLQIIGQPMVSYGFLDRLSDANVANESTFMNSLTQFVNQLDVDTEIAKRIAETIPVGFQGISPALRNFETALVAILKSYEVPNFRELIETINNVLNDLEFITFKDLHQTVKNLIKRENQLKLDKSTLEKDLESKPELECNVGSITIQQFQHYKIEYIETNGVDKYQFYLNALQTFARCYVLTLNNDFCKSQEEFDHCKTDQNYFLAKLNSYIEFSKKENTLTELIGFKNEIFYYMGSQSFTECIQTLKLIVEIHQIQTISAVYSETKILYKLIGIDNGTTNFIQIIKTFILKYGETQNFIQTISVIEKTLSMIGPGKSAIQCASIIKSLVDVCGKGGETVEKVLEGVDNIKRVYTSRLPEEEFSISEISTDLESFIDKSNTEKFSYIPGETNNQKLEYVHVNLTHPLQDLVAQNTQYSDLVKFFKKLKGGKEGQLDQTILDAVVERHNQYESLEQKQQSLLTNLKEQNLQLESCTRTLEEYKVKYEVSVKSNNDYADRIKELEGECSIQKNIKLDHDSVVQQLNDLKKDYNILENKHKLVLGEVDELRKKYVRKIATVQPKKRKYSDPGDVTEGSSEKRRGFLD